MITSPRVSGVAAAHAPLQSSQGGKGRRLPHEGPEGWRAHACGLVEAACRQYGREKKGGRVTVLKDGEARGDEIFFQYRSVRGHEDWVSDGLRVPDPRHRGPARQTLQNGHVRVLTTGTQRWQPAA